MTPVTDRISPATSSSRVLDPSRFAHYVQRFNAQDVEDVVHLIPNAQAWPWMVENVPLFECPDATIERTWYYRWWTYRKHIKPTPVGTIITEFILPVRHAGTYNSISCATGHHLAEGRWIAERRYLDEYTRFWFRADNGRPEPKFHKYSSWIAVAMLERSCVLGDLSLMLELLDDLDADYRQWEQERLREDGLFWQYDVRDGMEESISGSRTHRNARPTINSYMFGNAVAITQAARAAERDDLVEIYSAKAEKLRQLVHARLWDAEAEFFKAQTEEGPLSDAREAIGFIPWRFMLPRPGYEAAWRQLIDPEGFWAPCGITTAERRHPQFRSHGVGNCEWDGAVWPFATTQTLEALANVLRHYDQPYVSRADYLQAIEIYARVHQRNGQPYIGEYHDEVTGEWLKGDNPRSRYYNHSTFCDLIITGLVGLVPRLDDCIEIDPLLPAEAWDWFCLDRVRYHGHEVSIVWDRTGERYGRGAGLSVYVDGRLAGRRANLGRLLCRLGDTVSPGERSEACNG